jgi:hypothetical protein
LTRKVFLSDEYDGWPSLKLSAACERFQIPIQAHNSLSDITATMKLANELKMCRIIGDLEPVNVVRNYSEAQP